MTPKENILEFIKSRPKTVGIVGYGSGIKPQRGQENRKLQIDLIVIVNDLKNWHKQNIKMNKKDYSFSSRLFFKYAKVNWLKAGGKICYMTYLPFNGSKYKIGTIELADFLNDLKSWETFYMAGRMQKPILIAQATEEVEQAIEYNRYAALSTTQLLIGENKIDKLEFYMTLAGLSYIGDTRMGIAENPDKVKNIVEGSLESYEELYGAKLKAEGNNFILDNNINIETLPDDLNEFLQQKDANIPNLISEFLTTKNKSQSTSQTIKGLFTTGPIKSIKYVYEKLKRKKKK